MVAPSNLFFTYRQLKSVIGQRISGVERFVITVESVIAIQKAFCAHFMLRRVDAVLDR